MHAVTTSDALAWTESRRDAALDLIDAAVHDLPTAVLVVRGTGADARIAYANDAMQGLTGNLLGERSDLRLSELPLFGSPLAALLDDARAHDGVIERRILVRGRQRQHELDVEVSPVVGDTNYRVLRLDSDITPAGDGTDHAEHLTRSAAAAGVGHWHWDLMTGGAWYDREALRLLGGTAREANAKLLHSRVHDDDRAGLLNAIRRHLEQNVPLDLDFRLQDLSPGSWIRLRGTAARDGAGLPTEIGGIIEDVTARHQAVEDLHAAQEFLRALLNSLNTSIAVLDEAGEIIELNSAWAEFPSTAGLAGQRFGFGMNYPALARAAQDRCAAGRAAADGIARVLAGEVDEFKLDYRVVCLDGNERAMQMRARPFATAGGRKIVVTHSDMSGLDRATRAVRENEAFYRMILNALPLYVSYVSGDREVLHANRLAEEWLGQPIEALRGHRLDELMDSQSYAALDERICRVLLGRRVDFETRIVREAGAFDLAVSYVPHVVDGRVEGFFSVARDVTQEKRLESELLQSQKMEAMGRLTGGIAHDFNNVLSVIMGNLQLIEREVAPETGAASHARAAFGAATRGADLTRRLLSFARPKSREAASINPNALIGGFADIIGRTLGSTISLSIDLEPQPWSVRVDAGELENALLNLAINARDAMPDGGALRIVTRNVRWSPPSGPQPSSLAEGDYVEITVKDTGSGMPPEVARKAFEPFFTTKEPGKGTGLGLSIIYGFAIRSGGSATIDSTPGIGTAVRLLFPRCVAGAAEPARIVLVAGSRERATAAGGVLRACGYTVVDADGAAAAAVACTAGGRPDLAIIDSSADDAQVRERLGALTPPIPTLSLSGATHPVSGASTCIVQDDDLAAAVRDALAQEPEDHV